MRPSRGGRRPAPNRRWARYNDGMSDDLRRRLRRLGVVSERRKPKPFSGGHPEAISVTRYEADHVHGPHPLGAWLGMATDALALVVGDGRLRHVAPDRLAFLDTETTGLSGGVGTLVFMVGLGRFEGEAFALYQLFVDDPANEPECLAALDALLDGCEGLVTFNGRAFDVPLLFNRYVLARRPTPLMALPNLDLLPPSRRLWRRRLDSCALRALEQDVLDVERVGDIPGYRIPQVYRDYLAGLDDADLMARVFEHNRVDVLSLVALGVTLCRAFTDLDSPGVVPRDLVGLARWHQAQGDAEEGERVYRAALDNAEEPLARHEALLGLAALLKRMGRRSEALPLWEELAAIGMDATGHEELAKHYEWHDRDLAQALAWTEGALALARGWRPGIQREETLVAFEWRQARLLRKLGGDDA
jgi:uncharacterized protein YprB with RNaseH-like and TPR domain